MRQTLVIPCAHAECPNTLTLGADERQPKDWLCPTCLDRADEQAIIALEAYYAMTAPTTQRMN